MKQLQVNTPSSNKDDVRDVLEDHSSDVFSVEAEKNDEDTNIFYATVDSSDIDEITEELKAIKDIEVGDLGIRVLTQDSLIEKGQKTRGSSSKLSQEEVYSKAQESAAFNRPQWILMALSSAIASYGLMLDNIAVVIGAMMLAPVLSPIVSSSIAVTIGDTSLMKKGLFTAIGGVILAVTVSALSVMPFTVEINSTMNTIVSAGFPNLILSLFVGSAAALAFVTGYRDQIAGVAVAVALVPPLAATGIGLTLGDQLFTLNALSIAVINLLSVLISGSISLKLLGFKPSTYYKKKNAEKLKYILPISILLMAVVAAVLLFNPYTV